jgi:hypothetical protein
MEDLPDPALMLAARDAAYAEWYALDRPSLTDAEWAIFEPMAFRLLNAHARHLVRRFQMAERDES